MAVDLAHVVVQQHIGRARRAGPQRRADDARAGEMRLHQVGLEILVEVLRRAHGPEPDGLVHLLLAEAGEATPEVEHPHQVARLERSRVGRRHHQHRFDEAAVARDVAAVAVVGLGVVGRVPRDLAAEHVVVAVGDQAVAAGHHGDVALVGDDLEAVARQLELAHDLGPHQAADVGAVRVGPAVIQLAADRRAADVGIALEHHHVEPRPCEIGPRRQAVVPGADDDRVVDFRGHDRSPQIAWRMVDRILGRVPVPRARPRGRASEIQPLIIAGGL